jgi:nicotinate-nucleotide adenylyltransferase
MTGHGPIGLLGGTFDPIHYGHLRLAEEMADGLGLEKVRFIPAGLPPHRQRPEAPADSRLEMVKLAIAGNPRFAVEEYEIFKTSPCYMVETLEALRDEVGYSTPLVLLLGLDAFAGLEAWHEWQRLLELAHIAVGHRPGYALPGWELRLPEGVRQMLQAHRTDDAGLLQHAPAGRILERSFTQLDISASRLREMTRADTSLRYLLPEPVIRYIRSNNLYR